jgi:alkylation response protein AidB-like acyl-CoA dehydrogenase
MTPKPTTSEAESRAVAEAARQAEWKSPSFLRELFLGSFRLDLIYPFPGTEEGRPEFNEFFEKLRSFLREHVDPVTLDAEGEYPREVVDGLKKLGAFGLKVPKEYGGLGFSQIEFSRVMELVSSWDGSVAALLSAHQSIGVPQPLKLFGTEEQKREFLPRCAAGAISGLALTEEDVGSDPARLATTAELTPDGSEYILNGEKLWCTNGTHAELIVVMAREPKGRKISGFVVETAWPGVTVEHKCRFMGLKAISNGVISFKNVRVPAKNLIGKEGQGLKIALMTLNTGRLSLPACASGLAKACVEVCRKWSATREQWGGPIGKHEAIAHKLADIAATGYAIECVSDLAAHMADRGGYDIRLEAASAKEYGTMEGWHIVDDAMQVRGGRGYETEASLASRGDQPIPMERMMRDARINTIFEGSSEIMHLFMAREAVDRHLQVAGALVDPKKSIGQKLAALPKMAAFYAFWYPTRWLGWGRWPRYSEFGRLATHLRFAERKSRKLAREIFHGMVVHGAKLEKKQAFLFRLVDVANELFAMSASVTRAKTMADAGDPAGAKAETMADLVCRNARRRVRALFRDLWGNHDAFKYAVGQQVMKDGHTWLEDGSAGLPHDAPVGRRSAHKEPAELSRP